MPRAPEPDPPGIPELPPGLIGAPSPRAGVAYRLLRRTWRVAAWALRFRLEVAGLERLPRAPDGTPAGGWIAAGLPHRSWIDPLLLWLVLPPEPRLVFFGDARTMARSPLRRWVVRRVGGVLPIPSHGGPHAVAVHLAAAGEVIRSGAVFCLFPESGLATPAGTTRAIAPGIGYVALRTGATVVPVVIGGNDLLFLGRRIAVRVGEPVEWRALAGEAADLPAPEPGSHDERRLARRVAEGLAGRVADDVRGAHEAVAPPPGARLRGTRLTRLFR
jgi:1-acyl-sn-glycerol-3-phosphate acyltransferase